MQETQVRSLGQEDSLEKGMATHSSILAWRVRWTEEPGGLQPVWSQRVGQNWATKRASLVAQRVKHLPVVQETWVWFLGREDPLEKEIATHSSTLAWEIPWTEKPGRLQSMRSQRVGHAEQLTISLLLGQVSFKLLSAKNQLRTVEEEKRKFMGNRKLFKHSNQKFGKIPWRKSWQPTAVFLPGKS